MKKIILFFFGFQNYVNLHELTQVLSSDFKKTPFILTGIFLFIGPPLLTLNFERAGSRRK